MLSPVRKSWAVPTQDEERDLLLKAHEGDIEARNELVSRNLPFILKAAAKHWGSRKVPWLEQDDFIQAAALGMMHAIKKWSPDRADGRFVGYAKWWVMNYIDKEVHYTQAYRVPVATQRNIDRGIASKEIVAAAERFTGLILTEFNDEDNNDSLLDDSDILADVLKQEEVDLLKKEIAALPDDDRDVLMRWLDGETYTSIAKIVGNRPDTVRNRINRLVKVVTQNLRELFQEEPCYG